jgi:hypothetical protein
MEAMRMGRETVAANCRHLAAWVPWISLACWLGAAAAGFYGFGMVSLSRAKASDAELIRSTEAWFHGAAAPGTRDFGAGLQASLAHARAGTRKSRRRPGDLKRA